jgi:mRNA-degrading endonuclease RelE of RelBE toxin-antitoxin system
LKYEVRLIDDAVEDLLQISKKDKGALKVVLTRLAYISRDAYVGSALSGDLGGFRKLRVTDPAIRIIWKVVKSADGSQFIEVAHIWAIGRRRDDEIYKEMKKRVKLLSQRPETSELGEVLGAISSRSWGALPKVAEPAQPVPSYLEEMLIREMKLTPEEVAEISGPEALDLWTQFIKKSK